MLPWKPAHRREVPVSIGEKMEEKDEEEPAQGERKSFTPPSAKELTFKEITGKEERVAVVGTLLSVNKAEMSGRLSDESLECGLVFTEGEQLLGLKEGTIVRVLGKPSKKERILSIEVEILQELKGFDSNLYTKVKELEKKHYSAME